MFKKKIVEWGRQLDAGDGHDPLLKLSKLLQSMKPRPVTAPADFRDALLDDLLVKHGAMIPSDRPSARDLAVDFAFGAMAIAVVAIAIWSLKGLIASGELRITPGHPALAGAETSVDIPPLQISPESCAQASPSEIPHVSLPLRPDRVLGGGTVESGPFVFDLWLYCDSGLGPDIGPYLSIGGLGMHNAWVYMGPNVDGEVLYSFGVLPDISPSGGWDHGLTTLSAAYHIHHGFCCQEESVLRQAIQSGGRVEFAVKVESGAGTYGAVLSFMLIEAADGYDAQDIRVMPLMEQAR